MPVHAAQTDDCAIAQCRQTLHLQRIHRRLAGVGPGRKDRRQKKNIGTGALGLPDFPGIVDRGAVQQPASFGPAAHLAIYALGAPKSRQYRCSRKEQHMPMASGESFDGFKSPLPLCVLQMIVTKDDPAAARQPLDCPCQTGIVSPVGKQPYFGQDRARPFRQCRAGLVSQHKQAYSRKLGERE